MGREQRKWTDEDVETLRRMWLDGETCDAIAKRLGRRRNSLIGRVYRMRQRGELPERKDGLRSGDGKPAFSERAPAQKKRRKQHKKHDAPPPPPPKPVFRPRGIGLMALKHNSCRWIVSGSGADARYCGNEVANVSYCAHHHRRAYSGHQEESR